MQLSSNGLKNIRSFFDGTISPFLRIYKDKEGTDDN